MYHAGLSTNIAAQSQSWSIRLSILNLCKVIITHASHVFDTWCGLEEEMCVCVGVIPDLLCWCSSGCVQLCWNSNSSGGDLHTYISQQRPTQSFIVVGYYTKISTYISYCYCWLCPCRVRYILFKDLVTVSLEQELQKPSSRTERWSFILLILQHMC